MVVLTPFRSRAPAHRSCRRARLPLLRGELPKVRWKGAAPLLLLLGAVVLASGCGGGGSGSTPSRSGPIGEAEIQASSARNAHDLVQGARPQWLRGRGATSLRDPRPTLPVAYVDGMRYGSVETLRQLPVEGLVRVEYLSGPDATNRFGTGHTGGVILVYTRR